MCVYTYPCKALHHATHTHPLESDERVFVTLGLRSYRIARIARRQQAAVVEAGTLEAKDKVGMATFDMRWFEVAWHLVVVRHEHNTCYQLLYLIVRRVSGIIVVDSKIGQGLC